jgi:chemotaxis response regulator CheB
MTPGRDDGGARAAIGIGASAGGVDALTRIMGGLTPDLDACPGAAAVRGHERRHDAAEAVAGT